MRRRDFITFLCGALVCPLVVRAQQADKRPLIAVLTSNDYDIGPFLQDLREHGRIEGQNIRVEVRSANGNRSRLPALAKELIHLNPDVIITAAAAPVSKELTATIPIVELELFDPIDQGLIESFAKPNGNVTGILFTLESLPGKQLELLRQMRPSLRRVGLIVTTKDSPASAIQRPHYEAAAATLGITLVQVEVRTRDDFEGAFQKLINAKVEALAETPSGLMYNERHDIAARLLTAGLPAIFNARAMADVGGLMSYGRAAKGNWRRAADFANRILNGAKPGDPWKHRQRLS